MGWAAECPWEWVDPRGKPWSFPCGAAVAAHAEHLLVHQIQIELVARLWDGAAKGRHGLGLCGVPDLQAVYSVEKRLAKAKRFGGVQLLKLVVPSATWPDGRVCELIRASETDGSCALCGATVCDETHVAWGFYVIQGPSCGCCPAGS